MSLQYRHGLMTIERFHQERPAGSNKVLTYPCLCRVGQEKQKFQKIIVLVETPQNHRPMIWKTWPILRLYLPKKFLDGPEQAQLWDWACHEPNDIPSTRTTLFEAQWLKWDNIQTMMVKLKFFKRVFCHRQESRRQRIAAVFNRAFYGRNHCRLSLSPVHALWWWRWRLRIRCDVNLPSPVLISALFSNSRLTIPFNFGTEEAMGLPSAIQNCVSSPPRRFHWRPPRAALEISLPSHLPKRDGVQFLCNRVSSLKTGVFIALLRAWIDIFMFFFLCLSVV